MKLEYMIVGNGSGGGRVKPRELLLVQERNQLQSEPAYAVGSKIQTTTTPAAVVTYAFEGFAAQASLVTEVTSVLLLLSKIRLITHLDLQIVRSVFETRSQCAVLEKSTLLQSLTQPRSINRYSTFPSSVVFNYNGRSDKFQKEPMITSTKYT